ncbi:MerR family transcriptional regulator [Streptomyces sp. A0642]|uniref:MerR family transcriptional regulator n=1 Tax=Streptomyces sp. A0642 TaxID=2563100 RepID=UPI0010A27898|nr:MerR family transcriptional regulator [Streptomyces sp. A0642]THA78399.1 MerR family transcriptional regulator [Streptomyces sp. A0642]
MTTTWLTAAEAAAHADRARQTLTAGAAHIKPATIRQWASRGHLQRTGLTERGHPLYSLADVARAEVATRSRALRLAGIPEALTTPTHP